ncbi:MAG: hypothetical protein ABSF50_22205 [Burkholderiaceae bacterium]|jgi:hypothetical protein
MERNTKLTNARTGIRHQGQHESGASSRTTTRSDLLARRELSHGNAAQGGSCKSSSGPSADPAARPDPGEEIVILTEVPSPFPLAR